MRQGKCGIPFLTCLLIVMVCCHGCSSEYPSGGTAPKAEQVPAARFSHGPARLKLIAGDGVAGFSESAPARFSDPWGIVAGPGGGIYVADAGDNDTIRFVDVTGRSSVFAGSTSGFSDGPRGTARFDTPSGIAIDATGTLYVADTGNDAIRRVDIRGTVTTVAGGNGPGYLDGLGGDARFNGPIGVAVDEHGNLYVADTYNHRVRRITRDGAVTTIAGNGVPGWQDGPGLDARFDTPCALTVVVDGSLWVADTGNRAIRRIAPDGTVSTLAYSMPDDHEALLRRPLGIAADADGVYVTEAARGRILRYGYDGAVQVITGQDAGQALGQPAALAIDGSGLLVADATSARIYRVDDTAASDAMAPVGPAADAPLPATSGRWPIAPQDAWHEIVGVPGEVRGNDQGESRDHLHGGLDVRADVGAEVHAMADGKVSDPLPAWGYGKLNEGLAIDRIDYIHMRVGRDARDRPIDPRRFVVVPRDDGKPARVQVRRGTRFHAGDVLGTVNAMAHTHLSLTGNAANRNAFELGLTSFVDHTQPTIEAVTFHDSFGTSLRRKSHGRLLIPRDPGGIQIVVEAWDQVDGNLPRRRLGLYSIGYQVLRRDGTPAPGFETPLTTIVFDVIPTNDSATQVIYAPDSGETVHGNARTRFLHAATHWLRHGEVRDAAWNVSALPPGNYVVRIFAGDWSGNVAERRRDVPVTLQ